MTWEQLRRTGIWNTLRMNFSLLPWRKAVKLPFFVARTARLGRLSGHAELDLDRPNVVQIGYPFVGMIDPKAPAVVEILGSLKIHGRTSWVHGSGVSVQEQGTLEIGDGLLLSACSRIVCAHSIVTGTHVTCSWDVTLIDSDLHPLFDAGGERINPDKPVRLGNHVWIGFGTTVSKGAVVPDGCVVGSNSVVTKPLPVAGAVYAGNPVRLVREGVTW